MKKTAAAEIETQKTPTDEEIIAAILLQGSISKAAEALGISIRTVYERRKDADFRLLYANARADIMREAVTKMQGYLSEAVEEIAKIMRDQSTNPATRLQAAQTLISYTSKLSDHVTAEDEKAIHASNPWDIMMNTL